MKENVKALNVKLQKSEELEASLNRKMMELNLVIDREKNTVKMLQSEIKKKE